MFFINILFCLLSFLAQAQNNHFYHFHTFSLKDGLTQSTVYAVLRDNKGFLWIGTGTGLSRFDGQQTTRYFASVNDVETIPGDRIISIIDDAMDNVWILTSGGLVRFDDDKNSFERQELNGKPLVGNACCVLSDGFLCTSDNAFYKYNYKNQAWQILPVISEKGIDLYFTDIIELVNKKILLSARHKGLYLYDMNTGLISEADFYGGKVDVNKIYLDSQNRIWVAPYGEGLMCYSQTGQLIKTYNTGNSGLNNDVVLDIIEHDGNLWFGTDGGGINILDTTNDEFSHIQPIPRKASSFPANAVVSFYKDKWNNLWVGTIRSGLIEVNSVFMTTYQQSTFGNPYGLSNATVISLFQEDDDTVWIGTDGGGINKFHIKNGSFEHFQTSVGDKVTSIAKHTKDELLISVFGQGVFYFNKKTGLKRRLIVVNEKEDLRVLGSGYTATLQTNDGIRYLILSDSIYEYNSRNNSFSIIHLDKNIAERGHVIRQVISDPYCRFLFTANTLYSRIENGGWQKLISFPAEEVIGTVALGSDTTLWIGANSGLKRFNPRTDSVPQSISLPSQNIITSLVCDNQNRLWIGVNGKLWVYYINKNYFEQFDESSGALPNEYMPRSAMVSINGNVYMGGVNGLLFIDKDIPPSENTQPVIILNEVTSNYNLRHKLYTAGKNVEEIPHLKLAWNKSSMILQIMPLERDIFRKRLYRYSVSGLSGAPIETEDQNITLQSFPPGSYTVSVSCNLSNGLWGEPKKILQFSVLPPWWKSSWFITLVTLIGLATIALSVFFYIRKKEKAHKWQLIMHEQEVYEEKLQFLTNISHELRTPLTLIYAPLKRIMNQLPEIENIKYGIAGIFKQASKMKEIIDMVLDMRKIETGNEGLSIELYSLHEWIMDTADHFSEEMKQNKMELRYNFDKCVDEVAFDKRKCTIVLSNLLSNALKFGGRSGKIIISTKLNKAESYVRISVSDEGIGLGDIDIDRLFSWFYQGKHEYGGSGIGLAFSKKLVEMHNGKMGALDNSNGKGATFYFELPIKSQLRNAEVQIKSKDYESAENERALLRAQYGTLSGFDTSKFYLLVVEDNPDLLSFLKESFSNSFHAVLTATNGEDALEIIRRKKPDIVLSDVVMPCMDGFDLCRIVKSDITISHIPVVLLTSRTDSKNMMQGYKLGADAYVTKPFDIDFLQTMLVNQLRVRERIKEQYKLQVGVMHPHEITFSNADEHFMLKFNTLVEDHLNDPKFNVAFIATEMGMSRASLYNKMKELLNIGVKDYINRIKLEKAAVLLISNPDLEIVEIASRLGFSSQRYFSTSFKQYKGVSPSEFRKGEIDKQSV